MWIFFGPLLSANLGENNIEAKTLEIHRGRKMMKMRLANGDDSSNVELD